MSIVDNITYEEVLEINGDGAVAAIEKVILAEFDASGVYRMLDNGHGDQLCAEVGDVQIYFRPEISTSLVDNALSHDWPIEMTDTEVDEACSKIACKLVAKLIDEGLAQRIWRQLCDQAQRRAESSAYYATRAGRAAWFSRHAA